MEINKVGVDCFQLNIHKNIFRKLQRIQAITITTSLE